MLIVLVAGLFLGCVAVLIVKKNRESLLLAATCFSLMLFLMGIMIVIAKRGGVSAEVERFLYFSRDLRIWLQYRLITLNQTGYLLALGRHLFPLCLLELAMVYSMAGPVRKHPWVRRLALALPVITLIFYCPALYRYLVDIAPWTQAALYCFSWIWVIGYVVLALILLAHEFCSITIPLQWPCVRSLYLPCIYSTPDRTRARSTVFTAMTTSGSRGSVIFSTALPSPATSCWWPLM